MPIVLFILPCFHPLMFHFYIVNLAFISTMATLSPFNFFPFLNTPFIHLCNFLLVSSIQYITNPFLSINIVLHNTCKHNNSHMSQCYNICPLHDYSPTCFQNFKSSINTHLSWILDKILASFVWFKSICTSLYQHTPNVILDMHNP